jgi:DNA-binding NtrC family response regulator
MSVNWRTSSRWRDPRRRRADQDPELPVKISQASPIDFALPSEQTTLAELEQRYIEQVYRQTGFHKSNTSSILGVSRKTLDRKLKQYAIDKGE